jgi:signal transduction histidine kinase
VARTAAERDRATDRVAELNHALEGRVEELNRSYALLARSDRDRRALLTHLLSAQEAERQRIAADVHDDQVQALTALTLQLEASAARQPRSHRTHCAAPRSRAPVRKGCGS